MFIGIIDDYSTIKSWSLYLIMSLAIRREKSIQRKVNITMSEFFS